MKAHYVEVKQMELDKITDWCCSKMKDFCDYLGNLNERYVKVNFGNKNVLPSLEYFHFCQYCGKKVVLE